MHQLSKFNKLQYFYGASLKDFPFRPGTAFIMAENLTNHSVNYDNSTSDILRQEINRYVSQLNFILTFVQAFILCAGLLGNTLTLIIINQRSLRKTSSSVFITYMAIFDSAVLLCHAGNLVRPRRNVLIHCSLTYLTDFFTFCANWILVIITLGISSYWSNRMKISLKFYLNFRTLRCCIIAVSC